MSHSKLFKRLFCLDWARIQAGMCPGSRCIYWGYPIGAGDWVGGCSLGVECGPICTRDSDYDGPGELITGHTAGFDFFDSRWCSDAERQLPTEATREFWFPAGYNRTQWREQRYHRRRSR